MTTRTEIKMVEQEVLVFVAEDGTEFANAVSCEAYEGQLRAMRRQEEERETREAFERLLIKKWSVGGTCGFLYDTDIYICKLNSAADYEVLDKFCEMNHCEMDYLDAPKSFPCRYIFSVDQGGYACTERDSFMDWAREIIKVLDSEGCQSV